MKVNQCFGHLVPPDRDLDDKRQVPLWQLHDGVIFWFECDVTIGPLHPPSRLDMLGQADFTLKLLPLCLRGDWHATPEDHVDFRHMLISVEDLPAMLSPTGILRCRRCWRRHLFVIYKSFVLF
jgi:hypothetical protein